MKRRLAIIAKAIVTPPWVFWTLFIITVVCGYLLG